MNTNKLYAAVDLGSNSFHMIIMKEDNGRLILIDRLRELVQLAFGITELGDLDSIVEGRAIECLKRFGERLSVIEKSQIKIVGTNSLRNFKNRKNFIEQAEKILGIPIEVITSHEEARLIYLGVSQSISLFQNECLLIDIGGGSTEFIVGKGSNISYITSLEMGCVSYTKHFFKDEINAKTIEQACLAVAKQLQPHLLTLQNHNRQLIGSSGSIKTIANLLIKEGFSEELITLSALGKLLKQVKQLKSVKAITKCYDLSQERAEVVTAGLVILYQTFISLNLSHMLVAKTAMREGMILDLLGKPAIEDTRFTTISSLVSRFDIDKKQAQSVINCSLTLAKLFSSRIEIPDQALHFLKWAAQLHEIGLSISHIHFYKHSAYIIQYADLDSFSEQEQLIIATIIRHCKRKIYLEAYKELPKYTLFITIILRLAIIFNRNRQYTNLGLETLTIKGNSIKLSFTDQFIEQHALFKEDLETEAKYLAQIDYQLKWS